jgi:CRP/FNR family transcriptional regulator
MKLTALEHIVTSGTDHYTLADNTTLSHCDMHVINLTEREQDDLHMFCRSHVFGKKDVLYYQGEQKGKLYILGKGAVKLTNVTIDGRELILDVIGPHGVFGQNPNLSGTKTTSSALCIEPGFVYGIDGKAHKRIQERRPHLALKINSCFEHRRNRREENLASMLTLPIEQRLKRAFTCLLSDFGVPNDCGILLNVALTHKDFADMIASTRETVTSIFGKLRKEDLISYAGKYIVVQSLSRMGPPITQTL